MGLVKFRHRDGAFCEAEFPLAEMPELVAFTLENGQEHHAAKALFLAEWTQVVPDLPTTNPVNIPTMNVTQTPGDPVGTPAPAAAEPFHVERFLRSFASYVSEEFSKLHAALSRVEAAHPQIAAGVHRVEGIVAGLLESKLAAASPAAAAVVAAVDEAAKE